MTRVRIAITLAAATLLMTVFLAFPQGVTFAASKGVTHPSSFQKASMPTVTCSGYNCDGQDPITTGCYADAYTAEYAYIYDEHGSPIGEVDLRFSPTCGTNWTYVKSYIGPDELNGTVYRVNPYPLSESYGITLSVDMHTDMVYAPATYTAYACGQMENYSSNCTALG